MTPDPSARSLSLGKRRRLAQIADEQGRLALLAVDQRGNLKRALRPDDPDSVGYEEMVAFKTQVISAVAPHVTGALLDPIYGAAQVVSSGVLPGSCGLIVALERTGYAAEPTDRETRLVAGFDSAKAVRMGASAAKLLLYYHPDAPRAAAQRALVAKVAADCATADLPLIVEPLSFSLDPNTPISGTARTDVVVETARTLSQLNIDILKMEFPFDPAAEPNVDSWREACEELTAASEVPWLLLSAGVSFDLFVRQATVACESGASGVLAGRAVWREATELSGVGREEFLRGTAVERMRALRAVVEQAATPMSLGTTAPVVDGWFEDY